jgi:hypothetical protein
MKYALFIFFFLFIGISCSEISDVFPPLISMEQINGELKISIKDDEGIDKVQVQIKNSTQNLNILDTTIYLLGKKDLFFSKILLKSGNHSTIVKAYDINGNWEDKNVKGFNKVGPSIDSTVVTQITQTGATLKSTLFESGGSDVLTLGFCFSTNPNPTIAESFVTTNPINEGDFEILVSDLKPSTKYYIRSFASNVIGLTYGAEVSFITANIPATIAQINTKSITSISQTSAMSGGVIISDGRSTILSKGTCYSLFSNPTITDSITNDGAGSATYISALKNLKPNTKYYVRAYAINAIGTAYGNELNFTTNSIQVVLPTITTKAASQITKNSIKTGSFITSDGNGLITSKGICYSKSSMPTILDSVVLCGTGSVSFDTAIYSLTTNTKYFIRAFAINSAGTVYGNEVEATTLVDLVMPQISTSAINNITFTSASSGGYGINAGGGTISSKGICYATTSNPTTANSIINAGNGSIDFISNLNGLNSGTKYYLRAFAVNELGMAYGNEISFTTNAYSAPIVTTASATNITQTTSTVGGNVSSDGGKTITSRGICYGLQSNPTITDSVKSSGLGLGSFSVGLAKLIVDTVYYYRAYAINDIGISYGTEMSFRTKKYISAVVSTDSVSQILNNTAKFSGSIIDNGGTQITSNGFIYSTVSPVTVNNSTLIQCPTNSESFSLQLSNNTLFSNTDYYLKAFATNNNGLVIAYGNEIHFKTSNFSSPTVTTSVLLADVKYDTAKVTGNVTNDGGSVVYSRGICYSLTPNPNLSNSFVISGSGTGLYSTFLTSLVTNKTYYARAFATNAIGTSYGGEISFTTTNVVPGNFYQGGRVAYIFTNTDFGYVANEIHGIIVKSNGVAPFANTKYKWSDTLTNIIGTNNGVGYGLLNTNIIVNALGNRAPAAKICFDLIDNGYNDWFLPTKQDLDKIKLTQSITGVNIWSGFWTSNQLDINQAYFVSHQAGAGQYWTLKTDAWYIVPARYF